MIDRDVRKGPIPRPVDERFWEKVNKDGEGGCWLWLGHLDAWGYGQFGIAGKQLKAHRVAYELMVGPIPVGLTIDHLCRVPACVNPDHLEPVTNRENVLRGDTIPACHLARTHCDNGHEFTPENTYMRPDGGRRCRACDYLWLKAKRERVRAG